MALQKQYSEEELRKRLTPEQYDVLRSKATEPPFSGELLHNSGKGTYACRVCGNVVFDWSTKFDSGSGWPSFYDAVPGSVVLSADDSDGMQRTEVTCAVCGSHLGHVFHDAPSQPTGDRFYQLRCTAVWCW